MTVVDALEMVDVENDAAQLMSLPARVKEVARRLAPQGPPRQCARQAVDARHQAQLELIHHEMGEIVEEREFFRLEMAWLHIDAQSVPIAWPSRVLSGMPQKKRR